jgi:arylsulfatase A-like enzyme
MDRHVGQIREALEKAGVLDNTLILFTSDNGGVVAENERLAAQWEAKQAGHAICGALRGRKHSIYEGGFRVPYIVRWPGQVPAGTESDTMLCLTDVLATCAALLGQKLPPDAGEDSFNALAAWKGEPKAVVRDVVVLDSASGLFAIRAGDWKLIEHNPALEHSDDKAEKEKKGKKVKKTKPNPENVNQLFNLATDPTETKNLWDQHPDIVQRLSEQLKQIKANSRSRP